jgi:RimJ/RimL family protein N-acetyltransferase
VIREIGGRRRRRRDTGLTVLRDGSEVTVRPVRSTDAALLADGFARLSERSRQQRFLGVKNHLTVAELRFLTSVDHHDHEALGALSRDGRGVGVARFIRDSEDPASAEVAITIVDEWHGRGLGTKLFELLSDRARAEGVARFTATVAADNIASIKMVRNAGGVLIASERAVLEYEIWLVPWRDEQLAGWMRELDSRSVWSKI